MRYVSKEAKFQVGKLLFKVHFPSQIKYVSKSSRDSQNYHYY